jgi:hypothetical protein
VTADNETLYTIVLTDTLVYPPGVRPKSNETSLAVPLNDAEDYRFVRRLIEGYWDVNIAVYGDDRTKPLHTWNHTIIVLPQTALLIEQQADAEEKNANVTEANLFYSPIIAGGAAIGGALAGAGVTYFVTHSAESRRERVAIERQDEFNRRIRALIRQDLNNYAQYLRNLLANSQTVQTGPGGYPQNRIINEKSSFWPTLLFMRESRSDHYAKLTAETTANAFDADTLARIDESYRRFRLFIFQTGRRLKEESGNYLNYNMEDARDIAELLEDTIDLLG